MMMQEIFIKHKMYIDCFCVIVGIEKASVAFTERQWVVWHKMNSRCQHGPFLAVAHSTTCHPAVRVT